MELNKLYTGNTIEILKTFPDECIDMVITSPPYYGLRSYLPKDHPDKKREIGLEDDFTEYINRLIEIFRELKRALKKSGSFYLNISDTYAGSKCGYGAKKKSKSGFQDVNDGFYAASFKKPSKPTIKTKCMLGIPERLMLGLIADNWILRNKIIWQKLNHLPGSQKDRLTCSWEYVYHFVKNNKGSDWYIYGNEPNIEKYPKKHKIWESVPDKFKSHCWHRNDIPKEYLSAFMRLDYYYDLDIIRERHKTSSIERYQRALDYGSTFAPQSKAAELKKLKGNAPSNPPKGVQSIDFESTRVKSNVDHFKDKGQGGHYLYGGIDSSQARHENVKGKNPGDVFMQGEQTLNKNGHSGYFDKEGNPKVDFAKGKNPGDVITIKHDIAVERHGSYTDPLHKKAYSQSGKNPGDTLRIPDNFWSITTTGFKEAHFAVFPPSLIIRPILSSCPKDGIVLDPFSGAGTTCLVAKVLGRNYIGIDINRDYNIMAQRRINNPSQHHKVWEMIKKKYPDIYQRLCPQKSLFD